MVEFIHILGEAKKMLNPRLPFQKTLFLVAIGTIAVSCGKKDEAKSAGSTSLSLKIRNVETNSAPLKEPQAARLTGLGAGNLSFTPESYKLWINTIVLQGENNLSNQFYTCSSSEADCEVDFANPASIAAFEAKLSALPVGVGTFTKVWLSCTPDSGGYIKIKGEARLADGSIQYTSDPEENAGETLTADASKAGTLKIKFVGGSCGITMPLAKPLVVEAVVPPEGTAHDTTKETAPVGTTVTMTMFSNLKFTGYYTPHGSPGMGGCRLSDANVAANTSGPGICVIYPSVFPYFGETSPKVDYYKVANSKTSSADLVEGDANVIVKIVSDAAGKPFWASFGSYYTEDTLDYGVGDKGVSGYANSISSFSVNADGSLTMKSQENGFSAFTENAHSGEVKGEAVVNGAGAGVSVTYSYKAFPFVP